MTTGLLYKYSRESTCSLNWEKQMHFDFSTLFCSTNKGQSRLLLTTKIVLKFYVNVNMNKTKVRRCDIMVELDIKMNHKLTEFFYLGNKIKIQRYGELKYSQKQAATNFDV